MSSVESVAHDVKAIRLAVAFAWGTIVVEFISMALGVLIGPHPGLGPVLVLAFGVVFLVIEAVATYYFSKGRRWARVALAVFLLLSVVGSAMSAPALIAVAPLGVLALVELLLRGAALQIAFSRRGAPYFQAPDPNDAAMRMVLPVGRSGWAIAAGYLALFSVLIVPAPFALGCGLMAIREMRRDPSKHGMGRAIFGIVMGALGTAVILWILLRRLR